MLVGAALVYVGCAIPGPVIVVTEYDVTTADARDPAPWATEEMVAVSAEGPDALPTHQPSSQVAALQEQHTTVERRVSALQQGVTRVRGRQLVTNAIHNAVTNRVGSLEARIAALEVEFDRRAERLDTILGRLRDQLPDVPDLPDDEPPL